jgi:hypothetical protein
MNIDDFKTLMKTMIQNKTQVTIFAHGRHGIGKSAAVRQVGKELGYPVYSVILSQKEAVDVAGVLYTFENKELGMSVTSAHPPEWFAEALMKGKMILFLDEFNMARQEVMNAAFELVLDRRLNNKYLPDDVFIVCAGNPDDERYNVSPMSQSLIDRFMHIHVKPCVNAWMRYAKAPNSNIHPDVLNFIEKDPAAIRKNDNRDNDFPVEINHSERSWERVGMIHQLPLDVKIKSECIRGIVGMDLATAFVQSFGKNELPLTAEEILKLTKATKDKIELYCNPEKMRVDLLTASVNNLVSHVKNNTDESFKKIEKVKAFIKMLPDDVAQSAISQLFEYPGWSDEFVADTEINEKIKSISEATALKKTA